MMTRTRLLLLMICLTLGFCQSSAFASENSHDGKLVTVNLEPVLKGDAEKGKDLSETCAACHSADGNSVNPIWPKIAGQHIIYLVKQMKEFKQGESGPRNNPTMMPLMQTLSENDMINLATYFHSQKLKHGEADANLVERGRQLYRGGDLRQGISACSACHGPDGHGNELAKFPSVQGQHAAYTVQQLKNFKDGSRSNGAMMTAIAKRMSEDDMKAVASFIEGLH